MKSRRIAFASMVLTLLLAAAGIRGGELPTLSAAIPAQPLAQSLFTFATQTHLDILYVTSIVRGKDGSEVPAGLAADKALAKLLAGTGLRFSFLNSRCVRILATPVRPSASAEAAQFGQAENSSETIYVTGHRTRREQVPLSLVSWSQNEILQRGITDTAGLAYITPGVEFDSYPDFGSGIETNIALRGVNSRDGSTAAIYVDDTPIPMDPSSTFGRSYPLTFDMQRVDVLLGPQGVLYGDGAEGGAAHYITVPPSLSAYDGFTSVEYSSTAHGDPSSEIGAAIGGPIKEDVLGFRIGGWYRHEGGYVDLVDPFDGGIVKANSNYVQDKAARVALAFAPSGTVLITPSFDFQQVAVNDTSAFFTYLSDPSAGRLENGKLFEQPYLDRSSRATLNAEISLGGAELSLTSARIRRTASAVVDDSFNSEQNYPNPMGPEFPMSYADAGRGWFPADLDQTSQSHQIHLNGADPDARLTWLAGAGYLHSRYRETQLISTSALADAVHTNAWIDVDLDTQRESVYGQVQMRLAQRLRASLGARFERMSFDARQSVYNIFVTYTPPVFLPRQDFRVSGSDSVLAPSFRLDFESDHDNLYYASIAKGYRAGGPNAPNATQGFFFCDLQTPHTYQPDFLWNYELGAKNTLLQGRLRTEIALFHMAWHDIQTPVFSSSCGFGYLTNAGRAVNDGFDLGFHLRLFDRMDLSLLAEHVNAHYTQTVDSLGQVVVTNGDAVGTLPLVAAPWSATATLKYSLPLGGGDSLMLRADDVYHGHNPGPFTTQNPDAIVFAPERRSDPATNQLGISAIYARSRLGLRLFVDNVFDAQPTLQRRNRIPGDTLFYATTFRPRTIGVAVNWNLGPGPAPLDGQ